MVKGWSFERRPWSETKAGTPQGAVVSPLLANVYLDCVFDLWVEAWRKKVATGDVIVIRYADDVVRSSSSSENGWLGSAWSYIRRPSRATLLSNSSGKPPEFDQSRLVRM
jgi:retron-type reverse transcriptase